MRKIVDNERMMLRVCDLYYNRDMSQSDIAKIMDISRPTVARLLKSAKLKRIVEITISDPQERRYSELEQKLEKTYHLQEVIIADTVSTTNQQKDVLGKAAAGYLKSILKDNDIIGVGMGTTIRYIAPYAPRQFQNLTFIPLLPPRKKLQSYTCETRWSNTQSRSRIPFHESTKSPMHSGIW